MRLTPTEVRILTLISYGYTDREIGIESDRSLHTVRTHVGNINRRLHTRTRAQSVALALREGLID